MWIFHVKIENHGKISTDFIVNTINKMPNELEYHSILHVIAVGMWDEDSVFIAIVHIFDHFYG